MNKKLMGVLLVTGAAAVAVAATRQFWEPALKATIQEALIWGLDDAEEDGEEAPPLVDHWNEEGIAH